MKPHPIPGGGKVFLRWREIEKNAGLSRLYKLVLSEMVVLIYLVIVTFRGTRMALFTVNSSHLYYNIFAPGCKAISGKNCKITRNCLTSKFKNIVMQMRKGNREKGYCLTRTIFNQLVENESRPRPTFTTFSIMHSKLF